MAMATNETVGDVTTYHKRHTITDGLGRHVVLKLHHRRHVSYVTISWEWLPRCVIAYFVLSQH